MEQKTRWEIKVKVITHIEVADDWSEEQLIQAGSSPEELRSNAERVYRQLLRRLHPYISNYTLTVTVEDNTKEKA